MVAADWPIAGERSAPVSDVQHLIEMSGSSNYGKVIFTYSPSEFYFQRKSRDKDFDDVYEEVHGHEEHPLVDSDLDFGDLILAPCPQDHLFYRAQVKEFKENQLKVQLIDVGVTLWMDRDQCRKLDPKWMDLPPTVEKCALRNVLSLNPVVHWEKEDTKTFYDMIHGNFCRLEVFQNYKGTLIVDLLVYSDHDGRATPFSVFTTMHFSKSCYLESDNALLSYASDDLSSKFATPIPDRQIFFPGVECAVRLVYFLNPHHFYVRPLAFCGESDEYFTKLTNDLKFAYEKTRRIFDKVECPPKVGDALVYCTKKGIYYRAECLRLITSQMVEVILVDTGEITITLTKFLFHLSEEFKRLPKMAIKIRLHNVLPISPLYEWESESWMAMKKEIEKTFRGRKLFMRVVSSDNLDVSASLKRTDDICMSLFLAEQGGAHLVEIEE